MKHFPDRFVVSEADSGPLALRMAEENRPDIVLMDIRIPGMDGLEAARRILALSPSTAIFMISAHDNFEYARRALEIGARGYILKPFRVEDIVPRLRSVLEEPEERKDAAERASALAPVLESGLIQAYVSGNHEAAAVHRKALGDDFTCAFFLAIETQGNTVPARNGEGRPFLLREAYSRDGDTALLLVPVRAPQQPPEKDAVLRAAAELCRRMGKGASRKLRCGVGPVAYDEEGISASWALSLEALSAVEAEGGVLHGDDIVLSAGSHDEERARLEERFLHEIRAGRSDAARTTALAAVERICRFSDRGRDAAVDFAAEFLIIARNLFFKLGFPRKEVPLRVLFLELSSGSTTEELLARFDARLLEILEPFDAKPDGARDNRSMKALNYVNANLFSRDLSLESVAQASGCSVQYLSGLFKESYHLTFTGYVTGKRMELAKLYLSTSELPVSEIAGLAGYGDLNYFCRVFKKETGFRPNEFRTYLGRERQAGEG
jgi:two-component system response regulator YesN